MDACGMREIRDGYVQQALEQARRGELREAQWLMDRAAEVWPVEESQVHRVQRELDQARSAIQLPPVALRDPNRPRG